MMDLIRSLIAMVLTVCLIVGTGYAIHELILPYDQLMTVLSASQLSLAAVLVFVAGYICRVIHAVCVRKNSGAQTQAKQDAPAETA